MRNKREDIRNIAIIAHVDHGKTTLVDELLKQSGIFRKNENIKERVMDSNDLERERGITILSKNTAVEYNGTKINIIDTPGHADFGGEVERVLKMVSGVVLVVDAFEGPMPQTKFVLKKALELDLPVIVAINKIDRPEARPEKVIDEVLDLFIELDASEEQIEFPVVFTSAKEGTSSLNINKQEDNMESLFKSIIKNIPAPEVDEKDDLQVLISTIDYNEYVGRIGIGKVERGTIKTNQEAVMVNKLDEGKKQKIKITKLFEFEGLNRTVVDNARAGSIIAIAGVEGISIGDTICDIENPEALPFVEISEPTISMVFSVNNGPFAGREGKYVTSRQIRERLFKELHTDVSLRVEETDSPDSFVVSGRGELHLSILIETMRRQGYEFMVSKPKVLYRTIDNKKHEPMELVTIDVPEEFMGNVIEKLGKRKGEMVNMVPSEGGYTRLIFSIPARGLIGYRSEFMTDTKGNGIMNSIFDGYERFKGDIPSRSRGSLVASETGTSVTYGMYHVQDRGNLFIHPGTEVYEGMIVGMNSKTQDIDINVNKKKHLTSMRASGSEEALRLVPPIEFSLEEALEFIEDDELVEITPENIRLRKKILDKVKRKRANRKS
ncbi:translational GTPase TypA [Senegalia massiliensis]|uniref:Large ribosomal subunit assembly factor BipA n=1 Tax=Senegalia massiliensis TaxID=1720316 RepID=A0A845QX24_9CLOT|nr:translational GTPase TypA [Senegalia massiliensis]NBI06680.1 translational GTPase TypA [Senegalia massiliensis]